MSQPEQVELQVKQDKSTPNGLQNSSIFSNIHNENSPNFRSRIDRAGPLSLLNFLFVFPLMIRGWKADKKGVELTEKDLVTFPHHLRGDSLEKKFMQRVRAQEKKSPKKKVNTAVAVFMSVKWMFLRAVTVQTGFCFLRIFSAWVMKQLIECYLDPERYNTDAFWWAGIMAGVLVLAFYGDHHWNDIASRFSAYVRAGIISMIYNKVTRLSTYTITKLSPGQFVNLATNDVNTIEMLGFFFPSIVSGWLNLLAGAALLWIYFGVTCLIGVGYMLATIPIQGLIANAAKKPRNEKNEVTDERVRKTAEVIQDIRLLKMYTWETKFKDMILNIRKKDVALNNRVLFWECLSRALSWSSQYIASFLVFMLYYVTGGDLTISKVFSGYFILSFMKIFSAYFIAFSLGFMAEAKLFFKRLDNVMEAPEMGEVVFEQPHNHNNSIEFENFNGYWEKDETDVSGADQAMNTEYRLNTVAPKESKATLIDINLNIKHRSLNAVVGPVGSGKTSLLLAFTGEMPKNTGDLRYKGNIAYVEQEPTIFAGSFRESILFGKAYNEEFYNRVIKACNLENDLKLFPNGDMSMIGERGNNLSGGQRARLALARAVYADADIYLLDDPLSAVDAKVAKSIYNEAILGLLHEKTVILVTHQVHFVRDAKNIIVMEGGRVLCNGTFDHLKGQGVDVNRIFSIETKEKKKTEEDEEEETGSPSEKPIVMMTPGENEEEKPLKPKESAKERQPVDNNEDTTHFAAEDPHGGQVNFRTYFLLFKEIGWCSSLVILILSVITQFGDVGYGRILGAWTAGQFNLGESLGSLGGLAIYMFVIHLVKNFSVSYGLFGAAKSYHNKMLDKVTRSPVAFFDINPVGRILNRFANDIGVLDKFFPSIFLDVVDTFFTVGSVTITLAIIDPILLAPCLGALLMIVLLVVLYYPTIKKTKGFDLTTRGPLFSLLSSSISGVGIIRTFGNIKYFQNRFTDLLYVNTKGNINFCLASRLLGFCVDLTYTTAGIGMIFITTARITPDPVSGAVAAFCLALILSLTGLFQHGVRQFCSANVLMAATGRAQAYCNLPTEAPLSVQQDSELKSKHWPQKGDIEFNKVYMRYRPELDFTIRGLDLHAYPGEKIGCVGRTGAGKSTIINLLFRLQEVDRSGDHAKDSYIKIDDVNTQPLGLHLLRGNISIIPQTPFIFTGTIKENLDPIGEFTDEEIWSSLAEVRLKDHVDALSEKLETKMDNASSVFSTGQKQLICLARTLLKPSKVLVLDEATANMDSETDMFIQKKIMEKFADSTVFTIAHRLATIANYDKVLVLNKGIKVEFDAPYKLLAKNIGDNTLTNPEGAFGSMVMNTGPKASQRILNIAREAYFQKHDKASL